MAKRAVFIFLVGVLVGAVLLGGSVFALQNWENNAQAQNSDTWEVEFFSSLLSDSSPDGDFLDWVDEMPASCDIETLRHSGGENLTVYYRCPE